MNSPTLTLRGPRGFQGEPGPAGPGGSGSASGLISGVITTVGGTQSGPDTIHICSSSVGIASASFVFDSLCTLGIRVDFDTPKTLIPYPVMIGFSTNLPSGGDYNVGNGHVIPGGMLSGSITFRLAAGSFFDASSQALKISIFCAGT